MRSDAISKHNKKWVANSSVVLTCNTNARPPVDSYKIYLNGKLKTVSTSGIYRVKNLKSDDCGDYKCIPANEMGEGDAGYGNIDVRGIDQLCLFFFSIRFLICVKFYWLSFTRLSFIKTPDNHI